MSNHDRISKVPFSEGSNIVNTQWEGPLPEPVSLMGTPMAETGKAIITIDDDKIKERIRTYLAEAWDEGFKARHSGGVPDPSDDAYIVYGPNPYRP